MNKVTVSVPGKVHLMGEHAVVYGKPALLAAINLRLRVAVEPGAEGIEVISSEPADYIHYAIEIIKKEYKLADIPSMKITVTSDIPAGYHLGSSAAVAVATIGAVTYFLKKVWNPTAINQLAYEAEKKMHGNPSGGDNTIVAMGGLIWFRKELEFLKSIWQLPFRPHAGLNHFFLINTGRPQESTGEMVAYVRSEYEKNTSRIKDLLDRNEEQVKRLTVALKEGNEKDVLEAISAGERTLEGMGVVSDSVLPLIREIEQTGGVAKILGGGGRAKGVGFLLCYHQKPGKVDELCKADGYQTQPIVLGEEGIRLEEKD